MLKVGLTPKYVGSSSLYALSFILSNTLKGPSARGISFDLRKSGNLSLRKCNQTRSPGAKTVERNILLKHEGTFLDTRGGTFSGLFFFGNHLSSTHGAR